MQLVRNDNMHRAAPVSADQRSLRAIVRARGCAYVALSAMKLQMLRDAAKRRLGTTVEIGVD